MLATFRHVYHFIMFCKHSTDISNSTWRLHMLELTDRERGRERERQREVEPERNPLNLSRCISHGGVERFHHMPQIPYFVSTNQEVQTHRGAPHQPPILEINPSTCHRNAAARERGRVKTKCKLQMSPTTFLTGGWRSSSCRLMLCHGWQNNELYFTSVVDQGFYMASR